jgi:hypothetical protein
MNKYNLTIKKYNEKDINEWDDFIKSSNNGTIFHLQTFLKYHKEGKFDFTSYMIYNNNELVAVLPGGYKENGKVYWSPIGSSYGSIVTNDLHFEISLAIVDFLLDFFKKNGTKDIFLIPPPLIYSKIYNQHLEYAMLYRKFDFEYHYISHAIDLTSADLTTYNYKTRTKIKRCKENAELSVREVNDFNEYYPILLENKKKHNAIPTHSLEDLIKLKELFPDKIRQFNVYLNDKAIAGSTMFVANKQVALCFYNMLNYEYANLHPAYLTIDYVINWAKENGYKWFDFGVSQDTTAENPMTPSLPLIFFKELFNTRGIFRSTYHCALKC